MTPIASMVSQMIAAGVAPDMIALAVSTAEQMASTRPLCPPDNPPDIRVDTAAERRRKWDREYRQRRRQCPPDSVDIPPDSTRHPPDIHPTGEFQLYTSSDSQEKKERKDKKEIAARKIGRTIPPDWRPTQKHFDEAAKNHLGPAWVEAQATDMRLWAEANSNRSVARKADWDLTFLGWMRRNLQSRPNGHGPPRVLTPSGNPWPEGIT